MDEQKKKTDPTNSSRAKRKHPGDHICEDLSFAAREAFKRLRTNLIMAFPEDEEEKCRIIGITSCQPQEGKSTVSLNLAYTMAELGKHVLLIDADMRRPSIHEKAGVEKTPGLSDLTRTYNSVNTALKHYVPSKGDTSFDILPGGDAISNPSELLNSKRMATLLQTLSTAYDYIIIDLPPVGAVIDAVAVSRSVDGMLVVVRENSCPRSLLAECMSQLNYANINIIGFVLNGALEGSTKKYQYGGYGRYASYRNSGYYSSY